MHIMNLKLSMALIIGLPLGHPPLITPTCTFLVVLSLFMSSNLNFQFSCLLLITSKIGVFLSQSLPNLFTSHFVQSAHSLDPSHHAHLGSLHSPLLLLCQTPHLTAVQQRGHHHSIDYSQFCAYIAPSSSAPSRLNSSGIYCTSYICTS